MEPSKPSNTYWIICALGAGANMGLGNFIYASKYSVFGLKGLGLMGPGVLSVILIVKLADKRIFTLQTYRCVVQNLELNLDQR